MFLLVIFFFLISPLKPDTGEEKERAIKEKASIKPVRPAPPPPSKAKDTNTTENTNTNKKGKKSKDKSKRTHTSAEPPVAPSQAKPASKATPPSKDLTTMQAAKPMWARVEPEVDDDDEPREVENKMYMFDTESEEEEEADVKVWQRKTAAIKDPNVEEIEMSMKNIGTYVIYKLYSMHMCLLVTCVY